MKRFSLFLLTKLALVLVLSSGPALAHEVVPTIADLTVTDGRAEINLRINLEAFIAGVDLDTVEDTDAAPQARDYDALRALSVGALAARAPELLDAWNTLPVMSVDGVPAPLESVGIMVPQGVDPELPRIAEWTLGADMPSGASVTIAWPDGGGDLVVRQQGVAAPFTGLISGGTSSPAISLGGGIRRADGRPLPAISPSGLTTSCRKGWIIFCLCSACFSCRSICAR